MSDSPYRPLEGDPDELIAKARHYQEIGNAIARSANTLKAIGDQHEMTSKAVDALRDSSASVGDDIDKARERYQKTAAALLTYGASLRAAQDRANTAISHISAKEHDATAAHRTLVAATHAASTAADADKATTQTAATKAQSGAHEADVALQAAQQEWQHALDDKNQAAALAIAAIVDVVDTHNNGLNDTWWDDWGSALFSILKTICDWAGVLAIFLSWVPILGEVLLVLAAVGAVLDVIDAFIKLANGEGSWGDVIFAVVGAVLTLGGGKLIEMAAKGAKAMVVVKGAEALRGEGADVRVAMKTLQNAKWGEKAYMTQREASAAVREGREAFSTFGDARSTIAKAVKESIVGDGTRRTLSEAFHETAGEVRHGMVLGRDLNQSLRIVKEYPQLLHDPEVLKPLLQATGLTAGRDAFHALHAWEQADQADHENMADGNLHNPVRLWTSRTVGVVSAVTPEPVSMLLEKGSEALPLG